MKAFAVLVALTAAAPAAAATMAPADLRDDATTLSVGPFSLSADLGLMPQLTAGVVGAWFWPIPGMLAGGGARLTYRVAGNPEGPAWGVSLAGGYARYAFMSTYDYAWVQPSLTASLPLGDTLMLRGSIGPAFTQQRRLASAGDPEVVSFGLFPLPNLELAWRVAPGRELVFGGGDLVSARLAF